MSLTEVALSVHTIRDHVKSIYDKAGVTSRDELVAALSPNHVLDQFHATVEHLTWNHTTRRHPVTRQEVALIAARSRSGAGPMTHEFVLGCLIGQSNERTT